ncbi:MAG: TonB-dependent receptor, partial [Desulfarculaceae bacterium]
MPLGRKKINTILTATLMGLLLAGPPAWAEENPDEKTKQSQAVTLATIKVTAEKREASAQEVPISITAVSKETVQDAQVWSTKDLVHLVPNLFLLKTANHSSDGFLAIRGITSWMGGEPTVGFYVDDVFYSNYDLELLDVERIEVLRGPQGTLYGRNTEAGVVNVVSAQPAKKRWEGMASVMAGNYNTQVYRAHVTGPVVDDKLFIRLAAKQTLSDGYFTNTFRDDDSVDDLNDFGGRLTALWTPSDAWEIKFGSELLRYRDGYAAFAPLERLNQNPHDVSVDYDGHADYDAATQRLHIKYKGSYFNATAITAYRNEETDDSNDLDFTAMDLMRMDMDVDTDLFSQEIRFTSPDEGSAFTWLAGLYFFN